MSDLLTTADVARRLGVQPVTIRAAALRHGVGVVVAHVRLYTEADVARLRAVVPGKPGRPKASA